MRAGSQVAARFLAEDTAILVSSGRLLDAPAAKQSGKQVLGGRR